MINKDLIGKYFSVGDIVEVSHGEISKGCIIEISDNALVLKIANGRPCIIALSSIDDCKLLKNNCQFDTLNDDKELIYNIKELVSKLIETEDKERPISDKALVAKINSTFGLSTNKPFIKEIRSQLNIPTRLERMCETSSKYASIEPSGSLVLPASAEIFKYFKQHNNGAAKDEKHAEIRFSSDIVVGDSVLEDIEKTNYWAGELLPILCSYTINKGKVYANFVTRPCSLQKFQELISKVRDEGRYGIADAMTKYLEQFQNTSMDVVLKDSNSTEYKKMHQEAQKARLTKNFKKAELLYKELIESNYELDSVVKDLATMYAQMGNPNDAIVLMESYLDRFENNIKAYNVLYTLCNGKDSRKALDIVEKLIELNKDNPRKLSNLQKKKERLIKKINKKVLPKQVVLKNNDISILSKSVLVVDDIVNCEDQNQYIFENMTLDDRLNIINKLIKENENTSDLSKYYLQKLKIYSTENINDSISLNTLKQAVSLYCKAIARKYYLENKIDSARAYLMECIDITDDNQAYYLYLFTFSQNKTLFNEIYSNFSENPTYDIFFDKVSFEPSNEFIRTMVNLTNKGSKNSRSLVKYVYTYCLYYFNDSVSDRIETPQNFIAYIEDQFDDEVEFSKGIVQAFKDILSNKLHDKFLSIQKIHTDLLNKTDRNLFFQMTEVLNLHLDYENKRSYEDKKDIFNKIVQLCEYNLEMIESTPTSLAKKYYKAIFEQERSSIKQSMSKLIEDRNPIITTTALGEAIVDNDCYQLHIDIANAELCSRIYNAKLYVSEINGIQLEESIESVINEALYGGNHTTCHISIDKSYIKPSDSQVAIKCSIEYLDVLEVAQSYFGEIVFDIRTNRVFSQFKNPYAAADIVEDEKMFMGRDKLIAEICERMSTPRRGYVLYGQKRSGKSSVLWHVVEQLKKERKLFAVYFTMGSIVADEDDIQDENITRADLYYEVLKSIELGIKKIDNKKFREQIGYKMLKRSDLDKHPEQDFRVYLEIYLEFIKNELKFKNEHIVLAVDEITKMYYLILEKKISPQIMSFWKSLIGEGYFSIVWAGQDAMPRFITEYANDFGIFNPQPLSYLDYNDAKNLVEKPVWDDDANESRFDDSAVEEIIKITACSPYYIQHICSDVVSYANNVTQRLPITAYDVQKVVDNDMEGKGTFTIKDFDNLISCGDAKLDIVSKEDAYNVLRNIARYTRSSNSAYVNVNDIPDYLENEMNQQVVKELLRRDVLVKRPNVTDRLEIKIKVELFKKWAINHECY